VRSGFTPNREDEEQEEEEQEEHHEEEEQEEEQQEVSSVNEDNRDIAARFTRVLSVTREKRALNGGLLYYY